jgi:hypothetical protein
VWAKPCSKIFFCSKQFSRSDEGTVASVVIHYTISLTTQLVTSDNLYCAVLFLMLYTTRTIKYTNFLLLFSTFLSSLTCSVFVLTEWLDRYRNLTYILKLFYVRNTDRNIIYLTFVKSYRIGLDIFHKGASLSDSNIHFFLPTLYLYCTNILFLHWYKYMIQQHLISSSPTVLVLYKYTIFTNCFKLFERVLMLPIFQALLLQ